MKKIWKKNCRRLLGVLLAAGMVLTGMYIAPVHAQAEEGTQTVYRLYNGSSQEHLYTTDEVEVVVLTKNHGWTYEGSAWEAPATGTPVYRLYNKALDNHLYTSDMNEITVLTNRGDWTMDNDWKPLFYSGGDINVYRLYREDLRGMHLLTTDLNEYNTLAMAAYGGWAQEGVGLNCLTLGSPDYPAPGESVPDTPALSFLEEKGIPITPQGDCKVILYGYDEGDDFYEDFVSDVQVTISENTYGVPEGFKNVVATFRIDVSNNPRSRFWNWVSAFDRYTGTSFEFDSSTTYTNKGETVSEDGFVTLQYGGSKYELSINFNTVNEYPILYRTVTVTCNEDYDGTVFQVGYTSWEKNEMNAQIDYKARLYTIDELPFYGDGYFYFTLSNK